MTQAQYDKKWLEPAVSGLKGAANVALPFYRAHPYRGRLWITEVDMRVAVSMEAGFFYNRLPKTANSTLSAILYAELSGQEPHARSLQKVTKRPSRMTRAEVRALPDLYKVCLVRDPYTRTLSAYLDKIAGRKAQSRRPLRLMRDRFGTDSPSFEQFCLYLQDGGLYDDNHWAPQTHGLVLPIEAFDLVGRFESLNREIETITTRLFGAPRGTGLRRGPRSNANDATDRHYTGQAREIVRRLYAEDFEALGYRA